MTDAPKKPRKKAAPKPQMPKTQSKTARSDQEMREAVLAAVLPHAAFDGFTQSVLHKAGTEAGVAKAIAYYKKHGISQTFTHLKQADTPLKKVA